MFSSFPPITRSTRRMARAPGLTWQPFQAEEISQISADVKQHDDQHGALASLLAAGVELGLPPLVRQFTNPNVLARKQWRRLCGYNQLPKIIMDVKFNDGVEAIRSQTQTAAA